MTALAQDRKADQYGTPDQPAPSIISLPVKSTAGTIYNGSIVCTDATGYAVKGSTATGLKAWGVCSKQTVAGASNGAVSVPVQVGAFAFANSGTDPVAQADVGNLVYIEDDQTIAKTNGGATRSAAGRLLGLSASGQAYVLVGAAALP